MTAEAPRPGPLPEQWRSSSWSTACFELKGVLIAAAGDTQVVRLGELRTASGPVGHMKGRLAKVATASIARVTERRFDATRTALGGAGAALLATAALLMAFVIVLVHVAA